MHMRLKWQSNHIIGTGKTENMARLHINSQNYKWETISKWKKLDKIVELKVTALPSIFLVNLASEVILKKDQWKIWTESCVHKCYRLDKGRRYWQ